MKLSAQQVREAKERGFLFNRDRAHFSGRILTGNGVLTAGQLEAIARAAQKYGNGTAALTTRLTVEVQGIPFEKIDAFCTELSQAGLTTGGTGKRVRPIVACKGTVCVFGLIDTQALATQMHRRFYEGYAHVTLPHKFKIAVGGCPNNCVKPDLNDFGVVGHRCSGTEIKYKVFVGGRWGRATRHGTPLKTLFDRDGVLDACEKALLLYKDQGEDGERFGSLVDRLGIDRVEELLVSQELLQRKEEILR